MQGRQRVFVAVGAVAVSLLVIVVVSLNTSNHQARRAAYTSQLGRTAMWDLPPFGRPISNAQVGAIAARTRMVFFNPATAGFTLTDHFATARQLVSAATGPRMQVFDYFNVSYWYATNYQGLEPYARSFNPQWLLHDYEGRLIGFDPSASARAAGDPRAYMLDLANPQLRGWIVAMLASWLRSAPLAGVVLDSADPLLQDLPRATVGFGRDTFASLLCAQTPCARVTAWNAGLTALVASVSKALRLEHGSALYNGIAPSLQRGPTRNLGLLRYADGAVNEDFCYGPSETQPSVLGYEPVAADLALMYSWRKKTLVEITNFEGNASSALTAYCAGAFLLGWQPGSTYQIAHRTYADLDDPAPITAPETNLNLGMPSEAGYDVTGTVLTRRFEHGFVAVNTGVAPAGFVVPAAAVRYAAGRPVARVSLGQTLHMPAHSAMFFED